MGRTHGWGQRKIWCKKYFFFVNLCGKIWIHPYRWEEFYWHWFILFIHCIVDWQHYVSGCSIHSNQLQHWSLPNVVLVLLMQPKSAGTPYAVIPGIRMLLLWFLRVGRWGPLYHSIPWIGSNWSIGLGCGLGIWRVMVWFNIPMYARSQQNLAMWLWSLL